jgi:hypothetical protein
MISEKIATITCRNCEQAIILASIPAKGQAITCHHCNTDYEIINLEPLELVWLYREDKADTDPWFFEPYPMLGEGWWGI